MKHIIFVSALLLSGCSSILVPPCRPHVRLHDQVPCVGYQNVFGYTATQEELYWMPTRSLITVDREGALQGMVLEKH